MKAFGKLLAELRKKAKLSQNDLAQLIKTNPSHISRIERGERNPPKINMLMEMVKALNLNKVQTNRFISTALYSEEAKDSLVYYSPSRENDYSIISGERLKIDVLRNPAIQMIAKMLDDPKISEKQKRDFEEKILSFVAWLKDNLKNQK